MAQSCPVVLAHHTHAPAQIIAGVHKGIPTLLLVRAPAEAVLSQAIRRPELSVSQLLRGYIHFYKSVISYHDGFVVGLFQDIITDFGEVIKNINARFGVDFSVFEHTQENVASCFEIMEKTEIRDSLRDVGTAKVREKYVARPSETREEIKQVLEPKLQENKARALLSEAEAVYFQLCEMS